MPVAILGDVDAADAARVRTFAEEALADLGGVDLGVPVRVVERDSPDGRRGWAGWANTSGVFLRADELEGRRRGAPSPRRR